MPGHVESSITMRARPSEEARMRGEETGQEPHMWSYVPLEQRIPTAPRARGARGHGYDSADLSGPRHSVSATGAEARSPADEAVREGGARRKRPGGRQVREDRGPLGCTDGCTSPLCQHE